MRVVPASIPPLRKLGFSRAIENVFSYRDGLILVTGPTGSGKSTTIASIIDELNRTESFHIVTIEDPIEYKFEPKKSLINQREIGRNTHSFAAALRSALREDPDIIFVGKMRDIESIAIALTAAETGHLVLSTLHTIGAAKSIDRLIDVFPPNQQYQIRSQLSTSLRAVISQRLLPRKDRNGRVVAYEIMYVNNAIANLIRENKTPLINQAIQTGKNEGMITLNMCIDNLFSDGIISADTAADYIQKNKQGR
jgi:twitching motility protein PilT